MLIIIESTELFDQWLSDQQPKHEAQIRKRLLAIQEHSHLGDFKSLGEGLYELRWKNGTRIYFIRIDKNKILLLLGGLKNEQEEHIKKARRMFS